jgi:pSer/pThr/pTyr-binding forkhead associated (FHA) protein
LQGALGATGDTARRKAAAPKPAPPAAAPAPAMTQALPPTKTYLEGEDPAVRFPLEGQALTIGRFDPVTGLKPEVDLSAVDINRSVSRRHAKVQLVNGVYQISEEVGALNGTLLNNRRLVPGKSAPLKDGDIIHCGMVRLTFRHKT